MIFSHRHKNIKWPLITSVAIFFILFFATTFSFLAFENKYENRIYPKTKVGNVEVSGLTINQAQKVINQNLDKIKEQGFKFQYGKNEAVLFPLVSSLETDMAYEIISFNANNAIKKAYNLGRKGSFSQRLLDKWRLYNNGARYKIDISLNQEEIMKFLTKGFSQFSTPASDAKLIHENTSFSKAVSFLVEEEKIGQAIDFPGAISQFTKNLSILKTDPIKLSTKIDRPKILKKDCLNIEVKANKFLESTPLVLMFKTEKWTVSKKQALDWLSLKIINDGNDKVGIGLDFKSIESFLIDTISPSINQEPIDAKFEVKDGRVIEFQDSQDGLTLDIVKTFKQIEKSFENNEKELELIVRELKSELNTSSINDFGIREIIGTGHSDFSGSPKNRRHNIKTGADAVNGSLIKPGDEFSLIKTLGNIDKESGYLPELVIKDNKTIPEYGGGLCQIGTTLFRATINSGMPITMRRNHSYRVSYYEPAGTDATIYDPWPDYRFKNDSSYHILIQSRIEGDDIYFDFWSTEDGRIASSSYPTIYNITKPGPTKIIETLDLEPGQKKCTEHAHSGADAYFDYNITYTKEILPKEIKDSVEGELTTKNLTKSTRFSSHYVPWREVCLLGVEELSTSTEETIK